MAVSTPFELSEEIQFLIDLANEVERTTDRLNFLVPDDAKSVEMPEEERLYLDSIQEAVETHCNYHFETPLFNVVDAEKSVLSGRPFRLNVASWLCKQALQGGMHAPVYSFESFKRASETCESWPASIQFLLFGSKLSDTNNLAILVQNLQRQLIAYQHVIFQQEQNLSVICGSRGYTMSGTTKTSAHLVACELVKKLLMGLSSWVACDVAENLLHLATKDQAAVYDAISIKEAMPFWAIEFDPAFAILPFDSVIRECWNETAIEMVAKIANTIDPGFSSMIRSERMNFQDQNRVENSPTLVTSGFENESQTEISKGNPPDKGNQAPAFLGLTWNVESGKLKREDSDVTQTIEGKNRVFLLDLLIRAGKDGCTETQLKNGYPGQWTARRDVQTKLNELIEPLGIRIRSANKIIYLEDISSDIEFR